MADVVAYRPVGFGSHHWEAQVGGDRVFVTVDDLYDKVRSSTDSPDEAFRRLSAALHTAWVLREGGAEFVVAPLVARDGTCVQRLNDRYAVAAYPFIEGRCPGWAGSASDAERASVADLVATLHGLPVASARVPTDEFRIQGRDGLDEALEDVAPRWSGGPYSELAQELLRRNASSIARLLARHDALAKTARRLPDRLVLTHGEPHLGNVIFSSSGARLVDWDTTLLAPPERDLWLLDGGEGQALEAYSARTGVAIRSDMLELYRLGWRLTEIALGARQFRHEHGDTEDDRVAWEAFVEYVSAGPDRDE